MPIIQMCCGNIVTLKHYQKLPPWVTWKSCKIKSWLFSVPLNVLATYLLQDPILKNLLVIRAPNSTNFKVTTEEWKRASA
jgi:hypothetical protein